MWLRPAVLAGVFAGQGVAPLQEAGAIGATHVPFVTVKMLGLHPTLESLGAQVVAAVVVAVGLFASSARARPAVAAKS